MYRIGINFSNRGTTASYYDTAAPQNGVQSLNLCGEGVIETAVYYDEKADKWCLFTEFGAWRDYDSSFHGDNFIAPMEENILNKNMVLCAVFIRLVFECILKNHSFLKYDRLTGEKNFTIYAACPSNWNMSQIKSYKSFVSKIIPIEDVIKEDVAVFSKFNSFSLFSSTLIINMNYDVIDFTWFGEKTVINNRNKHGLNLAVKNICDYFEKNDADYQEAKKEVLNFDGGRYNKTWNDAVFHYVKNRLYVFYKMDLNVLNLDCGNRMIFPTLSPKRVFDSVRIYREKLENEILKDYRQMLMNDLEGMKNGIGHVDVVILTGEASRMHWVKNLLLGVFNPSKLLCDTVPLHTVSEGVLVYLTLKEWEKMKEEKKNESCRYLEKTFRK